MGQMAKTTMLWLYRAIANSMIFERPQATPSISCWLLLTIPIELALSFSYLTQFKQSPLFLGDAALSLRHVLLRLVELAVDPPHGAVGHRLHATRAKTQHTETR